MYKEPKLSTYSPNAGKICKYCKINVFTFYNWQGDPWVARTRSCGTILTARGCAGLVRPRSHSSGLDRWRRGRRGAAVLRVLILNKALYLHEKVIPHELHLISKIYIKIIIYVVDATVTLRLGTIMNFG